VATEVAAAVVLAADGVEEDGAGAEAGAEAGVAGEAWAGAAAGAAGAEAGHMEDGAVSTMDTGALFAPLRNPK